MIADNLSFVQMRVQGRQRAVPRADADFGPATSRRTVAHVGPMPSWKAWLRHAMGGPENLWAGYGAVGLLGPPGRAALISLSVAESSATGWSDADYVYDGPDSDLPNLPKWPTTTPSPTVWQRWAPAVWQPWADTDGPGTRSHWKFAWHLWLWDAVSALIYVVLVCLVACFYVPAKTGPPNDGLEHTVETASHSWRYGPFSCLGDSRICCWTCFCAPIRWADTMRMLGFFSFWSALSLWLGLAVLDMLTAGVFFWVALLFIQVSQRRKIRKAFRIDHSGVGSCVEDIVLYLCCPCCAVCQEARQVELARAVGHPAVKALGDA